ncbi:MAG: alpha/beta hydrolase, partial [bacterium]
KGKIVNAVKGYIPFKKFLRKFMESRDYRNLTGEKRETFKNIVNENLEPILSKIKCPTVIIWGSKDKITPLWQGKVLKQGIPRSTLVVIKGAKHGLPYYNSEETANIISKNLDS